MFKKIKSPRVTLRLITHKHAVSLFDILNNPLVSEFNDYQTPLTKEHIKQLIQDDISAYYEGEVIRLAIEHNATGQLLGTCGLYKINKETKSAFIGFELHPLYWQQGIMSEVLMSFMAVMPRTLNVKDLYAEVTLHNQRSHRLLKKLGFALKNNSRVNNNELWHKKLITTESSICYGTINRV
jgi:ribosomal-protein-alanine N-acetyltransferase